VTVGSSIKERQTEQTKSSSWVERYAANSGYIDGYFC
jgi:hypothetical protein